MGAGSVVAIAAGCLLLGLAAVAQAGEVAMQLPVGSFRVPVKSTPELRSNTVITQQYDFSCGSAAVATLLTYHYDRPVTEAEAFEAMFRGGDEARIRREGFSMLDMKRFIDSHGLRADGFRMSLDQLAEIGVPGIALVNTNGYKHFVVVRGVTPKKVLVADPAAGTVALERRRFELIWNGMLLAVRTAIEQGREQFNAERDWRGWPGAPVDEGMGHNGTGMFTLNLPGSNEFGR